MIQGYGTVDVFLKDPRTKGSRIMRLNDVAFYPKFAANLVSFHLLEKRGLYWDTRPQHQCLRITANHNVLALIERHYDQYVLEYNPINALEGSSPATFALRTRRRSHQPRPHQKALGERWHLRLGHPGPQALEHLVNHSSGVRIKGPTTVQCDNCGLAKMKRQIQRVPRHPDPELPPGDILAVDLHPFEADKKGFSHLLLVTDRATGFIWDFYLERVNSSLIRRTLNYLLGVLERQHRLKPRVIEADNELNTKELIDWMNAKGLVFEPSAPNTQSQNGAAERSGGVIKDKSRAMRGKLPTEMWREYVRAAVYLYNRTPRRFNTWKTPYESLLRHRPTLQHLKAYGCKAFAMTDKAQLKQERKKRLESKAWIGYLVGYTSTNIYRVWVPLIGRVINTRDVVFNEDDFFNGDLQCLKDDAKDTDLALLSQKLQEIALADDTAVHEEEHATSGGETEAFDDDGIIDFDNPP